MIEMEEVVQEETRSTKAVRNINNALALSGKVQKLNNNTGNEIFKLLKQIDTQLHMAIGNICTEDR